MILRLTGHMENDEASKFVGINGMSKVTQTLYDDACSND